MTHNTLGNGEWLKPGQSLFSNDGQTELRMQSDGKICVYWGEKCVWQNTPAQRPDAKGVVMQGDGNFCIYTNDQACTWASDTAEPVGNSTVICAVQDDGNVVLYKGTPIWATGITKD